MSGGKSQLTRRTVLRGASIALAGGLAGCSSLAEIGSENNGSVSDPADAPPSPDRTGVDTTGTDSNTYTASFPFLHPSTGTTNYEVELDGSPVMGSDDAPIDMYYWTDYLCPYCKTFALNIHSKLARNEVKEGTLRIVYLELPFKTEKSWPAAILAKSVWNQVTDSDPALYWDWSKTVYENYESFNKDTDDLTKFYEITDSVGIDVDSVKQYMRSNKAQIRSDIETEEELADKANVMGTPGFLLFDRETNATRNIRGAQPYSVFSQGIRAVQNNN